MSDADALRTCVVCDKSFATAEDALNCCADVGRDTTYAAIEFSLNDIIDKGVDALLLRLANKQAIRPVQLFDLCTDADDVAVLQKFSVRCAVDALSASVALRASSGPLDSSSLHARMHAGISVDVRRGLISLLKVLTVRWPASMRELRDSNNFLLHLSWVLPNFVHSTTSAVAAVPSPNAPEVAPCAACGTLWLPEQLAYFCKCHHLMCIECANKKLRDWATDTTKAQHLHCSGGELWQPLLVSAAGETAWLSTTSAKQYVQWCTSAINRNMTTSEEEMLTFTCASKHLPVQVPRGATRCGVSCSRCNEVRCSDCQEPHHFGYTCHMIAYLRDLQDLFLKSTARQEILATTRQKLDARNATFVANEKLLEGRNVECPACGRCVNPADCKQVGDNMMECTKGCWVISPRSSFLPYTPSVSFILPQAPSDIKTGAPQTLVALLEQWKLSVSRTQWICEVCDVCAARGVTGCIVGPMFECICCDTESSRSSGSSVLKSGVRVCLDCAKQSMANPTDVSSLGTKSLGLGSHRGSHIFRLRINAEGDTPRPAARHSATETVTIRDGQQRKVYVGQMLAGKYHGQGILFDPNTDALIFTGSFLFGLFHGEGKWYGSETYSGKFSRGQRQGYGTATLADHSTYTGLWFQDKRHGTGTHTRLDRDTYYGAYANGERHGTGTWEQPDGTITRGVWVGGALEGLAASHYIVPFVNAKVRTGVSGESIPSSVNVQFTGSFVGGKRHGFGQTVVEGLRRTWTGYFEHGILARPVEMTLPDGTLYKGEMSRTGVLRQGKGELWAGRHLVYRGVWLDDMMHGHGQLELVNGVYTGQLEENLRSGQGQMVFNDKTEYVGEWKADKQHGEGIQTFVDGRYWKGLWRNDIRLPDGKLFDEHGTVYVGCIKDAKGGKCLRYGDAIVTTSDGRVIYRGGFRDDVYHGNGHLSLPQDGGEEYIGEFKNGYRDGLATVKYPDGTQWKGVFQRGIPLRGGKYFHADGTEIPSEAAWRTFRYLLATRSKDAAMVIQPATRLQPFSRIAKDSLSSLSQASISIVGVDSNSGALAGAAVAAAPERRGPTIVTCFAGDMLSLHITITRLPARQMFQLQVLSLAVECSVLSAPFVILRSDSDGIAVTTCTMDTSKLAVDGSQKARTTTQDWEIRVELRMLNDDHQPGALLSVITQSCRAIRQRVLPRQELSQRDGQNRRTSEQMKAEYDERKPCLFVHIVDKDGKRTFEIAPAARELLSVLKAPIKVISVAGPARTGKSYILNLLADVAPITQEEGAALEKEGKQNPGFALGPTMDCCTQGLHLWARAASDGGTLLLLDTEGFGDPNRPMVHDCHVAAMSMLLGSIFVFNTMAANIQQVDIDKLLSGVAFVHRSGLCASGDAGSPIQGGSRDMDKIALYWLIRDFRFSAALGEDSSQETLRSYFKRSQYRDAIDAVVRDVQYRTLPRPIISERRVQHMESVQDKEMSSDFVYRKEALIRELKADAAVKRLNGTPCDGPTLLTLTESYIKHANENRDSDSVAFPQYMSDVRNAKNTALAEAAVAALTNKAVAEAPAAFGEDQNDFGVCPSQFEELMQGTMKAQLAAFESSVLVATDDERAFLMNSLKAKLGDEFAKLKEGYAEWWAKLTVRQLHAALSKLLLAKSEAEASGGLDVDIVTLWERDAEQLLHPEYDRIEYRKFKDEMLRTHQLADIKARVSEQLKAATDSVAREAEDNLKRFSELKSTMNQQEKEAEDSAAVNQARFEAELLKQQQAAKALRDKTTQDRDAKIAQENAATAARMAAIRNAATARQAAIVADRTAKLNAHNATMASMNAALAAHERTSDQKRKNLADLTAKLT